MKPVRSKIAYLAIALLGLVPSLRAETPPPSPLRLVPAETDFVVEVPHPRLLVESIKSLDVVERFLALQSVHELYDSTNFQRFSQFLAYFEKELGGKWPELLDRL